MDVSDLSDYCPEKIRSNGYILVAIEDYSKFGWTVPLKNKSAQTLKYSFENFPKNSKTKSNLIENDRGEDFTTVFFKIFLTTKTSFVILEKIY